MDIMNIEKNLTDGCDKASRIYSNMFNILEEAMHDEEKLKELSPLDFSALGMYIGKFVEQEINSSVVQIMRAFRGVPMPEFYCKPCEMVVKSVPCLNKSISINASSDIGGISVLRTITLGEAFYALEGLKMEDKNYFDRYPWLNEKDFLMAWHNLYKLRNRMAHIGEIIDIDTLRENYDDFRVFLKYMPDMNRVKKELAPKGYRQPLIISKRRVPRINRNYHDNIVLAAEPAELDDLVVQSPKPVSNPVSKDSSEIDFMNVKAKKFKLRKGKRGLKDLEGNIIVPPNYDDFVFLPYLYIRRGESVVAIRDGKKVLVALDGSGKELTTDNYDDIQLCDYKDVNSPYVYYKNGRMLCGFMDYSGRELCDTIIEEYICKARCLWYESGELWGYWNFGEGKPFLPPIFDNIEIVGKPSDPLLFTLKDVQGYVEVSGDSYRFIPMADLDKMDKETRKNTLNNCI